MSGEEIVRDHIVVAVVERDRGTVVERDRGTDVCLKIGLKGGGTADFFEYMEERDSYLTDFCMTQQEATDAALTLPENAAIKSAIVFKFVNSYIRCIIPVPLEEAVDPSNDVLGI